MIIHRFEAEFKKNRIFLVHGAIIGPELSYLFNILSEPFHKILQVCVMLFIVVSSVMCDL